MTVVAGDSSPKSASVDGELMGAGALMEAGLAAVVFVFGFYEALLRSSRGGSGPVS